MTAYFFADKVAAIKDFDAANPQILGEELERIKGAYGSIKTEAIWQEAKGNPSNPFYRHVDWDIEACAKRDQLNQIRSIVRILAIKDAREKPLQAFVSLSREEDGTSYHPIGDIIESADMVDRMLKNAERDMLSFEAKYKRFVEFVEDARALRRKIEAKRRKDRRPQRDEDRPSPR